MTGDRFLNSGIDRDPVFAEYRFKHGTVVIGIPGGYIHPAPWDAVHGKASKLRSAVPNLLEPVFCGYDPNRVRRCRERFRTEPEQIPLQPY